MRSSYNQFGPFENHFGNFTAVPSAPSGDPNAMSSFTTTTKLVPFLLASAIPIKSPNFQCDMSEILPFLDKKFLRLPPAESMIQSRKIILRTTDNSLAICAFSISLDMLIDREKTLGEVLIQPLKSKYGKAFKENGVELSVANLDGLFWNESNARGHRAGSRYKLATRVLDAETRHFFLNPPTGALLIVAIKGGMPSHQHLDATQQDYINAVMSERRANEKVAELEDEVEDSKLSGARANARITQLEEEVYDAKLNEETSHAVREQAEEDREIARTDLERARAELAAKEDLEAMCKQYEQERDLAVQDLADLEERVKGFVNIFTTHPGFRYFARLFGLCASK